LLVVAFALIEKPNKYVLNKTFSHVARDRTTGGKQLDLFNRKRITGFHGWGLEAPNGWIDNDVE
jgi:hypothetical protein